MTTPRISIAMATYNGERFLQEQLDSLARQTLLPYELVVCDDGSIDDSISILEVFAETASFPVRISQNGKNLGHGETFINASRLCQGDWIAFCDQDDVWVDHKLARCAVVIAEHPDVVLISHSAEQVDAKLEPLPHRIPNHKKFSITGRLQNRTLGVLPGFSCCVRSDLINRLPMEDRPDDIIRPGRQQPHDRFIYHVADAYGHTARLPESLALYRRHESTVTGSRGTGVYDRSLKKRLLSGSYAKEEGFRHMADQARQHVAFYQRVLDLTNDHRGKAEFVQKTKSAVDHYQRVAEAFETRAAMYADQAGPVERARLFARNIKHTAYSTPPEGCGLGWKAMVKDLARTLSGLVRR